MGLPPAIGQALPGSFGRQSPCHPLLPRLRVMDQEAISQAAAALVEARLSGRRIEALPAGGHPRSVAEAHAIQDLTVSRLGEAVGGWKAALVDDGEVMRGPIFRSCIVPSPARLPVAIAPLLGVEAEIAFSFERDMPPRSDAYSEAEVVAVVAAFAAIEVVDSRFASFEDTPVLDRAADCVSNAALVAGAPRPDWRAFDLAQLEAALIVDGRTLVRQVGGHAAGNPIRPTLALVNELRKTAGIRAGQVITAGTYTGLNFVKPGQTVIADFAGFGTAELVFDA
jgi:2-keto-4-pentenoate hydratase